MARKTPPQGTTGQGKLLSFFRSGGEWMAVVSAYQSRPKDPVLSHIVPVTELKGSARRKADRWLGWLA